jgi:5-methylcytosine-specific restriction protein A
MATATRSKKAASLTSITAESVERAITEFDSMTRDAFLKKYGFGKAKEYFLAIDGRYYDSKAIIGVAYKHVSANGRPLRFDDFSGGELAVRRALERLGFKVERIRNPFQALSFERGRTYARRADIHAMYGGQQQGGIATPAGPFIFLFTGRQGNAYGYQDGMRPDGAFEYTGEGQSGDMTFIRGNKAISDHIENGKDLLLFETLKSKGQCRYLGSFVCDGWDLRMSTDKDGVYRKAIVFKLIPLENIEAVATDRGPPQTVSLADLKLRAYAASGSAVGASGKSQRNIYTRSRDVRDYVLARADGICEACKTPALFNRKDGTPYLEPHHTRRVSDGGPDHPRWVGAICPTCHRNIHHGVDGPRLNDKLQRHLGQIEGAGV